MKIAITGSRGTIGTALVAQLEKSGHYVLRIGRSPGGDADIIWDPKAGTIDIDALEQANLDCVIHLAGEGIAEKKWSQNQKHEILESRTKGTELIASTIEELKNKPDLFICASAIGIYGTQGNATLNERSPEGEGFLADVCVQWEKAVQKTAIPTAIIRTGIVLTKSGGVLSKMLFPFKLGIGGRLGDGKQYMSWIAMDDEIGAIIFILENKLFGVYNLTAPNPVTNEEFTKVLGKQLSRPTLLPTPLMPLKIKYGKELVQSLMLDSQRAYPDRLIEKGYKFKFNTLETALGAIV